LLTHASDSDSETINLVGVGTDGLNLLTTNGVTLTTDTNWVYYTNSVTPNANDSFSYKVTDTRGCVATGTVLIQVQTNITGLATSHATANGIFQWVDDVNDLCSPPSSAYYRLRVP